MEARVTLEDSGASRSDVQRVLDTKVVTRLQKILAALAVIYITESVAGITLGSAEGTNILDWLACAISLVCWISRVCLRRNLVGPDRAHILAALIGTSILAGAMIKSHFTSDWSQSAIVVGSILVGSTFTLLSLRWFAFLALLTVGSWIGLAMQQPALPGLVYWSLALISTASTCTLVCWRRIKSESRLAAAFLAKDAGERQKRLIQENLQVSAQATNGALWYWDLRTDVFQYSEAWETQYGYEKGELEANVEAWFSRVHDGYLDKLRDQLTIHLRGESTEFENEHRLLRKDGTYVWVLARAVAVRDESGKAVGLAGSHINIASLIDAEKQFMEDSFHDKLTNLPNRSFFLSRLKTVIDQKTGGRRNSRAAVMFLDLDRFKIINDSLGHSAGDQLLTAVAERLRAYARPEDFVARLGGDEFVVLLERIRDEQEALTIGHRICRALSDPFQIAGREVLSGASIGIAISGDGVRTSEDFLRCADIAMYKAKSKENGAVQIFDDRMSAQVTKLCDFQNDLRRALARQQFVLHYQPTVSMHSGKIFGVEALIRWQRSAHELVAPNDFIPMAEDLNLISEIGAWALRSACMQKAAWQQEGLPPVQMAVNVSARQLQQQGFAKQVRDILNEANVLPESLELELTETALIHSLDRAPATLNELRNLGVRVAIDDFGTGYSSLNYLRQFHFRTLKMDRCFIADIVTDKKAAAVAKGLIGLAHDLNLAVVAEGVEREDQRYFLETQACDQLQGFLASRPLPTEQFAKLLRANNPLIELPMQGSDLSRLASLHSVGERPIEVTAFHHV